MPLYEYECSNRHRFELRQRFAEEPKESCPICNAKAQRLLHVVPVHFKGSGFYVTDYGGRSVGDSGGEEGKGSSKESATAESAPPSAAKGKQDKASGEQ